MRIWLRTVSVCLTVRVKKYVSTTTEADTVLTKRSRTQQHNFIPVSPAVSSYITNTLTCCVGRCTSVCSQHRNFSVTESLHLLTTFLLNVCVFSSLTLHLACTRKTSRLWGTCHVACTHISVCIRPFQLLNQLADFHKTRRTSYATESHPKRRPFQFMTNCYNKMVGTSACKLTVSLV